MQETAARQCTLCGNEADEVVSDTVALCDSCIEAWGDEIVRTGGVPDKDHPYYRESH
jgi:NMD protein affecting ribosome stability and mRNA decay